MLYILIACSLLFASYKYDYLGGKKGKLFIYAIFIAILIAIAGFRYELGIDSLRYEVDYHYLPSLDKLSKATIDDSRFGIGWLFLSSFAKTLSKEFFVLQLIQALYVNIIIGYFIRKNCKHPFLALLIYFIFLYPEFMFEILREACAVSTYLLGWKYFKEKIWSKYYLCCACAMLFHISAIVTFLVPLACLPWLRNYFKIDLKFGLVLVFVLIIGLYLSVKLFNFFATLSLIDSIQERAATYANMDNQSGVRSASILGFITMALIKIIYPGMAYYYYRKSCESKKGLGQTNLIDLRAVEIMIAFYMLFSVASFSILIFQRFTNYFAMFVIILIGNCSYSKIITRRQKYKFSFNMWMMILLPFFFIQIYGFFKEDGKSGVARYRRYAPYASVFFKEKDKKREKLQNFYVGF